jgi:hypothetical protein
LETWQFVNINPRLSYQSVVDVNALNPFIHNSKIRQSVGRKKQMMMISCLNNIFTFNKYISWKVSALNNLHPVVHRHVTNTHKTDSSNTTPKPRNRVQSLSHGSSPELLFSSPKKLNPTSPPRGCEEVFRGHMGRRGLASFFFLILEKRGWGNGKRCILEKEIQTWWKWVDFVEF